VTEIKIKNIRDVTPTLLGKGKGIEFYLWVRVWV
jgi:hypothetical protein